MSHGRPGDFAVFGAPVVWKGPGLSDADFCHAVGHDNDVCSGSQVAAADAASVDAVDGSAFGSNDTAVVDADSVVLPGVDALDSGKFSNTEGRADGLLLSVALIVGDGESHIVPSRGARARNLCE